MIEVKESNINQKYLDEQYENGNLEFLYNICMSITNSLKSNAGRAFEDCIEQIFINEHIPYFSQVCIDNDGIICHNMYSSKITLLNKQSCSGGHERPKPEPVQYQQFLMVQQ